MSIECGMLNNGNEVAYGLEESSCRAFGSMPSEWQHHLLLPHAWGDKADYRDLS